MAHDDRAVTFADAQVDQVLTARSQSAKQAEQRRRREHRSRLHDSRIRNNRAQAERKATAQFLQSVIPDHREKAANGAARAFALLGERWSLAILNQLADGPLRSGELERGLGIPTATLRVRLRALIAEGLLERHPYATRPPRFEYRLTGLGWDLYPALAHIAEWGETRLVAAEGKPLTGFRSDGAATPPAQPSPLPAYSG